MGRFDATHARYGINKPSPAILGCLTLRMCQERVWGVFKLKTRMLILMDRLHDSRSALRTMIDYPRRSLLWPRHRISLRNPLLLPLR